MTPDFITNLSKELITSKMTYTSEYAINFDKNIIHVFGELNEDLGASLRVKYALLKLWSEEIEKKEIKEITLEISSCGGTIYAIYAALDFFYELKQQGVLVNTKAHGICMSAATVLLCGGTGVRTALPRCKFMLHDMQIEGIGGTANQVAHSAKTITNEQMEIFSMYAEFSKKGQEVSDSKELVKDAKKWHKRFTKDGNDHYISAEEMLSLNLIDKVE